MKAYKLIVEAGMDVGGAITLKRSSSTIIGRSVDAHCRIEREDLLASRHHASLEVVTNGVLVRDMNSRHGTFVNGVRVTSALMRSNDRLQVGATIFSLASTESSDESNDLDDDTCTDSSFGAGGEVASSTSSACIECDGGVRPIACTRFLDADWMCDDCAATRLKISPKYPEIGGFDLLRVVGEGASAVVFEARHRQTGARVALKRLHVDRYDRTRIRRFMKEQQIAASFIHPRIVRCYEAGEDRAAESLYIAMEWLPERDASKLTPNAIGFNQIISLGADLFEALAYIHALDIIHRDVKPQNLLLCCDRNGHLTGKLSDFGITKSLRDPGSISRDQELSGTPLFMAPEQINNFKKANARADIYAGAMTLYHLLTQTTPLHLEHESASPMLVLLAALSAPRISLAERWPKAPPLLVEWMDRAVSADPEARVGMTTSEIADRLRRIANGPRLG